MDRYICILQSARATGKSTKLVQLSAKTQIPIMVRSVADINRYEFLAKELSLDILKPILGSLELSTPFNARSKGVLIDDLSRHLPSGVKGFTNSIESYDHLDWAYYSIENTIETPIKKLVVFGKYLIRASFTEGIPYFLPSHIYYTQIRAKEVEYYEITAITCGTVYFNIVFKEGKPFEFSLDKEIFKQYFYSINT